ncbi:hypothetical protein A33M_0667 [Rhodovulum sp. PH10]|nr:hypothetical protein A33M_0667 [Rhodovulum sp. PH10]
MLTSSDFTADNSRHCPEREQHTVALPLLSAPGLAARARHDRPCRTARPGPFLEPVFSFFHPRARA